MTIDTMGIVTIILMLMASTLLAFGTNWYIGASLFFTLWAIGGLLNLNR